MWRKKERIPSDLQGVDQRLRSERPQATPLELDEIKRTAMSRADASAPRSSFARRFVVAGLTVGLVAAGTGGVIAAGSNGGYGHNHNAAGSQYSSTVTTTTTVTQTINNTTSINIGSINNSPCTVVAPITGTFTCNIGTSGTVTVTSTVSSAVATSSTTGAGGAGGNGGVLGSQEKVKKTTAHSSRVFTIHPNFSKKYRLATEEVTINGKAYKFFLHGRSAITISFKGVACTGTTQHVKITAVTTKGKVLTESRTYKLCVS